MAKTVLIIGGGVVGCMSALTLAKRGLAVTLVERGTIAKQSEGASSWAGAGVLFPLMPWDYPAALNAQVFAGASHYADICTELLQETGIDAQYIVSGMAVLSAPMPQALDWCKLNKQAFIQNNNHLLLPTVAQIRPPRLLQALRAYLIKLGVTLVENTTLMPATQDFACLRSQAGEAFTADYYVIASGAWSGQISESIRIKPMRGQMLRYSNAAHFIEHILYQNGVYIVPRQDGELLVGSTVENVGFDSHTTDAALHTLKLAAESMIPALKNQPVSQHWSGLRPSLSAEDNLPSVAKHPTLEHVFINTGHFRYGLTMAPHSATVLNGLIA